jgi:hypothetical protein
MQPFLPRFFGFCCIMLSTDLFYKFLSPKKKIGHLFLSTFKIRGTFFYIFSKKSKMQGAPYDFGKFNENYIEIKSTSIIDQV